MYKKLFIFISMLLALYANAYAKGIDKIYVHEKISFHVTCENDSSINRLEIVTKGLVYNDTLVKEIDGTVSGIEVADLNNDDSPEIYVFVTSAGSGSYGSLVAYSVNNKKSLSSIYLRELSSYKEISSAYMGHDKFSVNKNSLIREFPMYKQGDSNNSPSGGIRELHYKLVQGEASWILELIAVEENERQKESR